MNAQTKAQIAGGKLLAQVKQQLIASVKPGTDLAHLDTLADTLLRQTSGEPSFKLVPGYHWATCINLNDGIVHGIPQGTVADGDLVTLDVGLYYQGFHTDTSTSFIVGTAKPATLAFLEQGKKTLTKAIAQAKAGNRVWDVSHQIQTNIEAKGYNVVRNLTGHGVGRDLHEEPAIPCYTSGPRAVSPELVEDQVIAIEVMYAMGDWHTVTQADGWTIAMADHSLSAVFEETVVVTRAKPIVVTAMS